MAIHFCALALLTISGPVCAQIAPVAASDKVLAPEDLLQGSIQERRARRKACASQWQHMKQTKGTDGQTWRDFTLKCYAPENTDSNPLK